MHRVLALIYAVPGVGWVVATLGVLLCLQSRANDVPPSNIGLSRYTASAGDRCRRLHGDDIHDVLQPRWQGFVPRFDRIVLVVSLVIEQKLVVVTETV